MIRAYLSHLIRGAKGSAATREDMEANNRRAIEFAAQVRAEFPGLDLYVPAIHDEFVLEAYEMGVLTESQILAVDVRLVRKRDLLIVYAPDRYLSNGMLQEHRAAGVGGVDIVYVFAAGDVEPIQQYLEARKR